MVCICCIYVIYIVCILIHEANNERLPAHSSPVTTTTTLILLRGGRRGLCLLTYLTALPSSPTLDAEPGSMPPRTYSSRSLSRSHARASDAETHAVASKR